MKNPASGIVAILAVSTIWGLSGLFYKALAHRTLWSLALFAVVLALRGRLGAVAAVLRAPRSLGALALAALMISLNWGGYIRA